MTIIPIASQHRSIAASFKNVSAAYSPFRFLLGFFSAYKLTPKLLVIALFAFISIEDSHAQEASSAGICPTCTTTGEFESFGLGLKSNWGVGSWLVEVYNPYTEVLYDVYIEKEPGLLSVVGFRSTSLKEADAKSLFHFFEQETTLIVLPQIGDTYESFTASGPEGQLVCPQVQEASSGSMQGSGAISTAIRIYFGFNPLAIVVFNNGDVAQYNVLDVRPSAVACSYKSGSARDSSGAIINDGSGSSSGGGYVTGSPLPGGGFSISYNTVYVSCARIGDGPITCEESSE